MYVCIGAINWIFNSRYHFKIPIVRSDEIVVDDSDKLFQNNQENTKKY